MLKTATLVVGLATLNLLSCHTQDSHHNRARAAAALAWPIALDATTHPKYEQTAARQQTKQASPQAVKQTADCTSGTCRPQQTVARPTPALAPSAEAPGHSFLQRRQPVRNLLRKLFTCRGRRCR